MIFSVEFVFRMIGMLVVGLLGWSFGGWAARICCNHSLCQPRLETLQAVCRKADAHCVLGNGSIVSAE